MLSTIILLNLLLDVSYECAATSSVTTTTIAPTTLPSTTIITTTPATTPGPTTTVSAAPITSTTEAIITTTSPMTTTSTTPTTTTTTTSTTTTSTTTMTTTTTTVATGDCSSCPQNLAQGMQSATFGQDGLAMFSYSFDDGGCIVPTIVCSSIDGNFLTTIALQENEGLIYGGGCPSVTLLPDIVTCNAMGQWVSPTGMIQPSCIHQDSSLFPWKILEVSASDFNAVQAKNRDQQRYTSSAPSSTSGPFFDHLTWLKHTCWKNSDMLNAIGRIIVDNCFELYFDHGSWLKFSCWKLINSVLNCSESNGPGSDCLELSPDAERSIALLETSTRNSPGTTTRSLG